MNQFEPLQQLKFEKEDLIIEQVQVMKKCPPSPSHEYYKVKCSSHASSDPPKQNKRGPNLEMVAYQLTQDLTNIFMQRQDWSIYHKEMVLQDNIRGVKMVGLEKYIVLQDNIRGVKMVGLE